MQKIKKERSQINLAGVQHRFKPTTHEHPLSDGIILFEKGLRWGRGGGE